MLGFLNCGGGERIEGRKKRHTYTTAEKGGKSTKNCKNYDTPISPSDPQASTNI
ncbi:MAG: hypothetical protein J5542_03795 [Bacteroidales bacterium]|nr:hypothetical protein [Bacteroidales bacterium]